MRIDQSIIVITAAGTLIGRAMALHFGSLGAKLALVDNDINKLEATQDACSQFSSHIHIFHLEDTQPHSIKQVFTHIQRQLGTFNVLLNTWPKCTNTPSILEPNAINEFNDVMCNSATTFFSVGQIAATIMQGNKQPAVIINLALQPSSHHTHLSDTSKSVIQGLTFGWSQELSSLNIRVGAIIPITSGKQTMIHTRLQEEIVSCTEYIITNDSFNGRILEAECLI